MEMTPNHLTTTVSKEQGPGYLRLMRMAMGFRESKILLVANDLNLFSQISEGCRSIEALALRLPANIRVLRILMDALVAMGILHKVDNSYYNHEIADKYLVKSKPEYRGDFLAFTHYCWSQWNDLDAVVKSGRAISKTHGINQSERAVGNAYSWGMDNMAKAKAERIAKILDLSGVRRMLDFGGGAATYSIAFAQRNSQLTAYVMDLPLSIEVARENIKRNEMEGRVKVLQGSYWEADYGNNYDLIWVSQIIHQHSESEVAHLIGKATFALRSGGRLIVHDSLLTEDRTSPYFAALFSIYLLTLTEKGRCYTVNETKEWLIQAGLKEVIRIEIDAESDIIMGVKP